MQVKELKKIYPGRMEIRQVCLPAFIVIERDREERFDSQEIAAIEHKPDRLIVYVELEEYELESEDEECVDDIPW